MYFLKIRYNTVKTWIKTTVWVSPIFNEFVRKDTIQLPLSLIILLPVITRMETEEPLAPQQVFLTPF